MRRALFRTIRDFAATSRRQVRRFAVSPSLALAYMRFRTKLIRRDWRGVHDMLRPLAIQARRAGDHRVLTELGYAALRLDEPQLGVDLVHAARDISGGVPATAWRGEDISDATLIVRVMESATQGVAVGMAQIGQIAEAAKRAARTVVIVEPRMVALFARSLPPVSVVPFGADLTRYASGKYVTANTNDLEVALGYNADTIETFFRPLIADPEETFRLRQKYLRGRSLPLIGISWWSSHYGKDLPTPKVWARLLREVPAQFVSLQYGDVGAEVAVLAGGDPSRLTVDPDIDQLVDMDRFASQIAALDLVVTISNSGAHLAGALGKPMVVVRDDLFRRHWPYLSRRVPWYPGAVVIGKDGRPWAQAFDEVIATARAMTGKEQR